MNNLLEWFSFFEHTTIYGEAILLTFQITVIGILLGTVIGLIFAFFKISNNKILHGIANFYISIIRGTPLLLQIFVVYMVLSSPLGLQRVGSAAFALAIHNGAYIAEIFRGAIQSIAKGQMEAARSLGMTYPQAMRRIILPQAFKRAIPPLGNQFTIALKDSSLATVIGVREILQTTRSQIAATFDFRIYIIAGLLYWLLTTLIAYGIKLIERRLFQNERQV